MGKKRKRKKHRRAAMKVGCLSFGEDLERLRDLARDHDLTVDVRIVRCVAHRSTYHVMFKLGEKRVLDYWPGNGRTWSPMTGAKGAVLDCWAALDEAARIAATQAVAAQNSHLDAIAGR